jgi:hypothetical protein
MDTQQRRKDKNDIESLEHESPQKRRKTNSSKTSQAKESIVDTNTTAPRAPNDDERPKSRRELRIEKQASKKAAISSLRAGTQMTDTTSKPPTAADILRLKKERRAETRKEIKAASAKAAQEREETHDQLRKVKKADRAQQKEKRPRKMEKSPKKEKKPRQDEEFNADVFNSVFYAKSEDAAGTTTCRLGVKYRDIKVGTGPEVQDRSLVTVKYKLKGGKFGALLDRYVLRLRGRDCQRFICSRLVVSPC